MLVAGDEMGRTQQGNNNAYCQDNEISWLDWERADTNLREFTQKLIAFRREHPVFCRRNWFRGQPIKGIGVEDIAWFLPDGTEMPDENWDHDHARSLAVFLSGHGIRGVSDTGERILDDSFYIIFNAYHEPLEYQLPDKKYGQEWVRVLDTATGFLDNEGNETVRFSSPVAVPGRSVVVFRAIE